MKFVDRTVTLIASTRLHLNSWMMPGAVPEAEALWYLSRKTDGGSRRDGQGQDLIEFAGRACYQSFSRPNPATAKQRDYFKNIIQQRHFSVFEHSSATFYLTGVSRSFTHELIRHRHLSYSQLSQRFVDLSDPEMVVHPGLEAILEEEAVDSEGASFITERLDDAVEAIKEAYSEITKTLADIEDGPKKKEIREAARAILPNMTATKIVVTGNMRAWRHFILMRATVHADREIQEIAVQIYEHLNEAFPYIFQDFVLENKDGRMVLSSQYGEENY